MANLTGKQINNTYSGLLKTEDNAAISGQINLTDGLGNQSGLFIGATTGEAGVTGSNPKSLLKNSNFNSLTYPIGSTGTTQLEFQDVNGLQTADILQDRYGSLYYTNKYGDQGEQHVFRSLDVNNAIVDSKISMTTWNAVNNSDNWFIGYNERITAGSFNSGTGDLTLTKPSGTDIVVNIPTGGGGSAGLVSGTGTDSMQSAASLTTNPAVAPTTNSIALGENVVIQANAARPSWTALGHIGIGNNINITENSFGDFYNRSCIAIGRNITQNPYYDGGNISIGDGAQSTNMHGIAIGAGTSAGQFAFAFGQNANASAESSIAFGRFANANTLNAIAIGASTNSTATNTIAIGQGATAEANTAISIGDGNTNQNGANMSIGRGNTNVAAGSTIIGQGNNMGLNNQGCVLISDGKTVPAGQNDFVGIGRINNPSGQVSNSIQIGLVSQVTDSTDSVAIGRSSSVLNANQSVAIGNAASATTAQSVAIGYNVTATKSNFVTVNELALTTTGGGIVMISPNGTEYKLTVSDAGALVIT